MSLITKSVSKALKKTFAKKACRIQRTLSVMFTKECGIFSYLADEILGAVFLGINKNDLFQFEHDRKKVARLMSCLSLVCKSWHRQVKAICPDLQEIAVVKRGKNIEKILGKSQTNILTLDGGSLTDFVDTLMCTSQGIRALCLTGNIQIRAKDMAKVLSEMTDLRQLYIKRVEFVGDLVIQSRSLEQLAISNFFGSESITIDCPNLRECSVSHSINGDPMNLGLGYDLLSNLAICSNSLASLNISHLAELKNLKVNTLSVVKMAAYDNCFSNIGSGQGNIQVVCLLSSALNLARNVQCSVKKLVL